MWHNPFNLLYELEIFHPIQTIMWSIVHAAPYVPASNESVIVKASNINSQCSHANI